MEVNGPGVCWGVQAREEWWWWWWVVEVGMRNFLRSITFRTETYPILKVFLFLKQSRDLFKGVEAPEGSNKESAMFLGKIEINVTVFLC